MSSQAEQQPLLAYPYFEGHAHPEQPKRTLAVWRENVARLLESQVFHTFVIGLVSSRFCPTYFSHILTRCG
jgi:hypothetical protein